MATIRVLLDWMVTGQVMPDNPASSVRGSKHVVETSKISVLSRKEDRALLDRIDLSTPVSFIDRALVTLLLYTFACVGAVLQKTRADVYRPGARHIGAAEEEGRQTASVALQPHARGGSAGQTRCLRVPG